ncbi:MAG: PadR family transcriptional regulator [Longimicrobiales bacterium]
MPERTTRPRPEAFLPLRPIEFQILLSLSRSERHGYGILLDAGERMGAAGRPSVGTLYRGLRRLEEQGMIEGSDRRPAPDQDDERRNYYRLTGLGGQVVKAEAQRLEALVRAARASGVLGAPGRQG